MPFVAVATSTNVRISCRGPLPCVLSRLAWAVPLCVLFPCQDVLSHLQPLHPAGTLLCLCPVADWLPGREAGTHSFAHPFTQVLLVICIVNCIFTTYPCPHACGPLPCPWLGLTPGSQHLAQHLELGSCSRKVVKWFQQLHTPSHVRESRVPSPALFRWSFPGMCVKQAGVM